MLHSFAAVILLCLPSAFLSAQTSDRVISDEELLHLNNTMLSDAEKMKFMGKTIVLGTHHGIRVIATHPCGDICPTYTQRVIQYDIPIDHCLKTGGKLQSYAVPLSISSTKVCIPAVLESLRN